MRLLWHTYLALALFLGTVLFAALKAPSQSCTLNSTPSAGLYLDNKFMGYTPLKLNLTKGSHALLFEAEGYEPVTMPIDVSTGVDELNIELKPKPPGQIKLLSVPDGGSVYIDGQYVGITPINISMPQGSYTARVDLHNYRSRSARVRVLGDSSVTVDFELENLVLPLLIKTVEKNPTDILGRIELAHFYMLLGKPKSAAKHYVVANSIIEKNRPDWLITEKFKRMYGDDSRRGRKGRIMTNEYRKQKKNAKK